MKWLGGDRERQTNRQIDKDVCERIERKKRESDREEKDQSREEKRKNKEREERKETRRERKKIF